MRKTTFYPNLVVIAHACHSFERTRTPKLCLEKAAINSCWMLKHTPGPVTLLEFWLTCNFNFIIIINTFYEAWTDSYAICTQTVVQGGQFQNWAFMCCPPTSLSLSISFFLQWAFNDPVFWRVTWNPTFNP